MPDLPEVKENHATMKRHLTFLGIKEVTEVHDSYDDFDRSFKEINKRVIEADLSDGKIRLLLYTYFAGHGNMYDGATRT